MTINGTSFETRCADGDIRGGVFSIMFFILFSAWGVNGFMYMLDVNPIFEERAVAALEHITQILDAGPLMFNHVKEMAEHLRQELEDASPHSIHRHWCIPTLGNVFWFCIAASMPIVCCYESTEHQYNSGDPATKTLSSGTIIIAILTIINTGSVSALGLTYGYSNTLQSWWKSNFLMMHVMHETPALTVRVGEMLNPKRLQVWCKDN